MIAQPSGQVERRDCPGGPVDLNQKKEQPYGTPGLTTMRRVGCPCGWFGRGSRHDDEAIRWWNTRAPSPELEAERAKVVTASRRDRAMTRAPMTHDLKCHPEPFQALMDGRKRFELRDDCRDYETGDRLRFREWDQTPLRTVDVSRADEYSRPAGYTGRVLMVRVVHAERYATKGLVVLSLDWPCPAVRPCGCVTP